MNLRKALAKPIHISVRHIAAAFGVMVLCAGFLLLAGANLPPPRFVLNADQKSVDPLDYPFWREASDKLVGRKYVVLTFDDGFYIRMASLTKVSWMSCAGIMPTPCFSWCVVI